MTKQQIIREELAALCPMKLTAKLNAAAERVGEPTGYAVSTYSDTRDASAVYSGLKVTGPNEARAAQWVLAQVKHVFANRPFVAGRQADLRENNFVCLYRCYTGE